MDKSGDSIFRGITVTATSGYNIAGPPDVFGIRSIGEYTGTIASADIYGIEALGMYSPTSGGGSATNVIGVSAFFSTILASVGSVSNGYGILVGSPTIGSIDPTTTYGVRINGQGNAGTTDTYGLYIDDQTGSTNNYPIYQSGATGTNYFNAGTSTFGRAATGNDTLYGVVVEGSLCVDDTTANCPAGPTSGAIYVENSVGAGNVSAFDISEYYPASEPVEKGDLVVVDPNGVATVKRSNESYQQGLIGIVATDPALVIYETNITFGKTAGNNFNPLKPYIAIAGRVPTKVSGENGAIAPGDPLTSSPTPGVAMKASRSGPIVGKALESYSSQGIGKIMVFVNVGWYVAPMENGSISASTLIDTDTLSLNSIETQVLIVGERQVSMNKDGRLEIDGSVQINGDLLVAGKVTAEEISLGEKSSGVKTLTSGSKKLEVKTALVGEKSKIFVTFTEDYSPATRYWVTKNEGIGFTVHLDQPVSADTGFYWLIIN